MKKHSRIRVVCNGPCGRVRRTDRAEPDMYVCQSCEALIKRHRQQQESAELTGGQWVRRGLIQVWVADPTPDPEPTTPREPRALKPCGTTAAYKRHTKRGESCDVCREAMRAERTAQRNAARRAALDDTPTVEYAPGSLTAIEAVAAVTGLDHRILISRARDGETARARSAAMYIAREMGDSYPAIGRAFGRDHTTVHTNVRRAQERPDYMQLVDAAMRLLREEAA